jgi:hypothetical protein
MDKEMSKVYIILYLGLTHAAIHMVTTDKAKAEAELAELDSFDYELREEILES